MQLIKQHIEKALHEIAKRENDFVNVKTYVGIEVKGKETLLDPWSYPEVILENSEDFAVLTHSIESIKSVLDDYGLCDSYKDEKITEIEYDCDYKTYPASILVDEENERVIDKAINSIVSLYKKHNLDENIEYQLYSMSKIRVLKEITFMGTCYRDQVSKAITSGFDSIINLDSRDVAVKLAKRLSENTRDKWTCREAEGEEFLTCTCTYTIKNEDFPEQSFKLPKYSRWLLCRKGDRVLTLPLLGSDAQTVYDYAKLVAVVKGKSEEKIKSIMSDVTKANPLYDEIPALEKSVCQAIFETEYLNNCGVGTASNDRELN